MIWPSLLDCDCFLSAPRSRCGSANCRGFLAKTSRTTPKEEIKVHEGRCDTSTHAFSQDLIRFVPRIDMLDQLGSFEVTRALHHNAHCTPALFTLRSLRAGICGRLLQIERAARVCVCALNHLTATFFWLLQGLGFQPNPRFVASYKTCEEKARLDEANGVPLPQPIGPFGSRWGRRWRIGTSQPASSGGSSQKMQVIDDDDLVE